MKSNVIKLNTLRLNSANLNVVGEEQNLSLSAGGDPEQPPVVPVTYILSASASNGVVSASVNGNAVTLPYTANEGDVVVVEVTANDGYVFEGWSDGSTDNPRSITMTADVTLSATCVVKTVEKEYIEFADPAVEAVLMANGVSSDGIGITMEDAAAVTTIGTWFKGNTSIVSFNELEYFTGVTTLSASAFEGCTALTSLPIERFTSIGAKALYNCTSLYFDELNLANLTTLGQNALRGVKIRKLNLGKVTTLPTANVNTQSYGDKSVLEAVDLPSTLNTITAYSFNGYTVLKSVILRAITPPALDNINAFSATNNCPIYVPDASLEAYKTATNWSSYADRIHPLSEIEDYYVSDALLMHLDGINKGNVEGEWQDLVSGNTFVNHGAVAETDGWRFDGASSYMNSATLENYGPVSKNRTFEIVVEFERGNTTEVVYMGENQGYAFGRYEGGECVIITTVSGIPSFADDMTSGVRIFSASLSNNQLVALEINGNDGQVRGSETFSGSSSSIYLGKRASGSHFKGKIHAIRIHDRVLTEEEILYNQRLDNKRFNLGLDI